jgi:cation diffusion facilitator family transporter
MHPHHDHEHDYDDSSHSHTHGLIDPTVYTTKRGIWALKWSFSGLFLTFVFQIVIVMFTGSVALLADTIHNLGDATTAIPLWLAFPLERRQPSQRFTYGLGRGEDLAGVSIVLIIGLSALLAGYESMQRLLNPEPVTHLWAVVVASLLGFVGNEGVALLRMRVGKEIGSAALIADGSHARADGLTSLAVCGGALGVWCGFPLADPLIGLLITMVIVRIVWESARAVFVRLLDGVDPEVVEEIRHAISHAEGVKGVSEVRVRWLGHRLRAEVNVTVDSGLSVEHGHAIAMRVRHQLLHHLRYLSNATIHIDPVGAAGEALHGIEHHAHDDLAEHSHA